LQGSCLELVDRRQRNTQCIKHQCWSKTRKSKNSKHSYSETLLITIFSKHCKYVKLIMSFILLTPLSHPFLLIHFLVSSIYVATPVSWHLTLLTTLTVEVCWHFRYTSQAGK
jgi:hypothetical protein